VTSSTIVIHGVPLSGHTHRVQNFLSILGLPYQLVPAPAAVRQTPAFRALNPLGQIPVLQDGDLVLSDSNAILVYLARQYGAAARWLPDAPVAAAQVQRWLSIAAGEMKFGPAAARILTLWGGPGNLADAQALAVRLLDFMELHLTGRSYLAADHPTIADISAYSYVAHAPEGRISLDGYPQIRGWLARIQALPGFLAMPASTVPEV
jgi:glutathione S-transferase